MNGVVTKFFENKGYGFIAPDLGGPCVMVHRKCIGAERGAFLVDGQRVHFHAEWCPRKGGRWRASWCEGFQTRSSSSSGLPAPPPPPPPPPPIDLEEEEEASKKRKEKDETIDLEEEEKASKKRKEKEEAIDLEEEEKEEEEKEEVRPYLRPKRSVPKKEEEDVAAKDEQHRKRFKRLQTFLDEHR